MTAYDREYTCVYYEEYRYLRDAGIRYEFVKEVIDDISGKTIPIWKYRKTKKLFDTLAEFYDI